MKNFRFIFLILFFLFFVVSVCSADTNSSQGRVTPLEISYPSFDYSGIKIELTSNVKISEYVKYIFYFFIGVSGFIALIVVVLAGLQYLTAADNIEKVKDAKNKIWSALFGLIILFFSVLILKTINPQFVEIIDPQYLPSNWADLEPGIWVCKESVSGEFQGFINTKSNFLDKLKQDPASIDYEELKRMANELSDMLDNLHSKCYIVNAGGDLPEEFAEDNIEKIYSVPNKNSGEAYGAILCANPGCEKMTPDEIEEYLFLPGFLPLFDSEGKVREEILNNIKPSEEGFDFSTASISYIKPFVISPPTGEWTVKIYRNFGYDKEGGVLTFTGKADTLEMLTGLPAPPPPASSSGLREVRSIKMTNNVFVIFFADPEESSALSSGQLVGVQMVIITGSSPDLSNTQMSRWNKSECIIEREPDLPNEYYPCAGEVIIIPGKFY